MNGKRITTFLVQLIATINFMPKHGNVTETIFRFFSAPPSKCRYISISPVTPASFHTLYSLIVSNYPTILRSTVLTSEVVVK